MSEATTRSKIRESIEPFPHTPRYPTGWGGDLTFEEIAEARGKLGIWGGKAAECLDLVGQYEAYGLVQ